MTKKLGIGLAMAVGFVGAVGGIARAGFKQPSAWVSVNTSTRQAFGNMGGARNTPDSNQYIGCRINASTGAGSVSGICYAMDSTGTASLSCTTTNANLITVMTGISSDSHIYFVADAAGYCTQVWVTTDSTYQPKQL